MVPGSASLEIGRAWSLFEERSVKQVLLEPALEPLPPSGRKGCAI